MLGVCPKCGTMHETTTESAFSPEPIERMCVRCYRLTLDEAAAACAEARFPRHPLVRCQGVFS
jgi:rRNA maturation protein Nop10